VESVDLVEVDDVGPQVDPEGSPVLGIIGTDGCFLSGFRLRSALGIDFRFAFGYLNIRRIGLFSVRTAVSSSAFSSSVPHDVITRLNAIRQLTTSHTTFFDMCNVPLSSTRI
jgi:hypothetical protein